MFPSSLNAKKELYKNYKSYNSGTMFCMIYYVFDFSRNSTPTIYIFCRLIILRISKYFSVDFFFYNFQDMKKFESEVRALQTALAQAQSTLTSPELGRLSLKEQLSHRQVGWCCVYL